MKKTTAALLLFIVIACIAACVTQTKLQYYDFPSDIAEEAKTEYRERIEKGRILYNINCSKCHTKKVNGKLTIPDFTTDQLDSYIIRIKNETHVKSIPETIVTPAEMDLIQFFFTYKKPSQPVPEK